LRMFHSITGPFALVSPAADAYLIDRRPLPALQPA
jgi:hypothetical protein